MSDHEHFDGVGHPMPVKNLLAVFGTLVVLTVITVAVAQFDLGAFNVVFALAIAGVKASVVAMFFMHLRYDKRFNFVIFAASICFVALMVVLVLGDSWWYQDRITEYKQDQLEGAP